VAATTKTNTQLVVNGLLNENPIFRLALSMCPAVGISTTVANGLLLGVAVLFVQVFSSCTIALIKDHIHPRIRIPTYTLTIATWVTVIDLVLAAFLPVAYKAMGIFVRLIVAFAIITMRLEVFACRNTVAASFWDGIGMGFGFMFGMVTLGTVREILGMGTFLGYDVLGFRPMLFFVLPAAGFFLVGFMMAVFNYMETVHHRWAKRRRETSKRLAALTTVLPLMALLLIGGCHQPHFIRKAEFKAADQIVLTFAGPVDAAWAADSAYFAVNETSDPDIRLDIRSVRLDPDLHRLTIALAEPINQDRPHQVVVKDILSQGKNLGTASCTVARHYLGYLFGIFLGALLIQNFVFSKYLGLCVFFGTSQKKSTAVGMGITFTAVIVFASLMSWFFYQFVLKPFRLDHLQIIVFIGLVSLTVQGVDTVLRKINPALFKAFGVYLVLVIANCIVIAVPLILADNEYNLLESLMLALGAGLGFLLALFLMSSVRERLELANVPVSYRGLPIAFIVAGLFALSFMGFSGMSIF
jgi:Na+-translocating ferredoxin:NAD+ oxidoreductase RnfA subunit